MANFNDNFKKTVNNMFNLRSDMASYEEIDKTISEGSKLQGTNMCILMLAIIVASVGLNMNSTAVIIGAMLISPLMGSIIAIGYGFATNHLRLSKKAVFRLSIQICISLLASTIYFLISPIKTPSAELLARTSPSAWDVVIAVAGGLAGIIGQTRKEKSNVIPGVAIATALMPPLCTAGYGLANLNFHYFIGALYLFFINGFFICVTAIIVLKILKVPSYCEMDRKVLKKIHRRIGFFAVITMLPSLYLAYQIVGSTVENSNAQSFLKTEFVFNGTQIVQSSVDTDSKVIEVALIGKKIDSAETDKIKKKLDNYGLNGYKLTLMQTEVSAGISEEEVQALINQDITSDDDEMDRIVLQREIDQLNEDNKDLTSQLDEYKKKLEFDCKGLCSELKTIYPQIVGMSGGQTATYFEQMNDNIDATMVTLYVNKELTDDEYDKITNFLQQRLEQDFVLLSTKIVDSNSTATNGNLDNMDLNDKSTNKTSSSKDSSSKKD